VFLLPFVPQVPAGPAPESAAIAQEVIGMKKVLAVTLLALAMTAGAAGAGSIGIGAFGGVNIPIVQDNNGQGSIFGVRVPVSLVPMLTVEPYYASSQLGDKEQTFAGLNYTREGGDETAFGVNAMFTFGTGFQMYPFVGLASYKIEQTGTEDVSDVGYNFGLGFGFSPVPKLALHVRGELDMIATGDTSRKFAGVTVGAAYSIFNLP
jgi:hypothetical protein